MNASDLPHDEEQEPKFKIVDRRRVSMDGEVEEIEEEPEEAETGKKEAETVEEKPDTDQPAVDAVEESGEIADETRAEAPGEEQDPLSYKSVVLSVLQTITSVIWIQLGLVPNPQTNIVVKKLEQARKNISLFEGIYQIAKEDLPEPVQAEIENLIADLKANYVNQL